MKSIKTIFLLVVSLALINSCTPEDSLSLNDYSSASYSSTSEAIAPITGERYNEFEENAFVEVSEQPISTFSIDADGASYSNVRRLLVRDKQKPPKGAVRTEELINYFPLDYPEPEGAQPFSLHGEISACPWKAENRLIRIGFKGKSIPENQLPASNIVLLIDVSGSMSSPDKLELLKQGFNLLVDGFDAEDRIAIVVYAGEAGVVLPATPGDQKSKIKDAINKLGSGGSTAGAQGILTAYEIAQENFISGGNNRIIIGTDGDFNVGPSSQEELITLIENQRDKGIFLTVLGVGTGNLNEGMLEQLANNGNGNFEYIDNLNQARKVFVHEFSKFYTVAKDVKIQLAFNPEIVRAYRLIGYENRILETEDFEDDKKDAGEINAGQNITALYEIIPAAESRAKNLPSFTVDCRYKLPDEEQSQLISFGITDEYASFQEASENMRFTATVAGFGMLLWDSKFKEDLAYGDLLNWLQNARTYNPHGYRHELETLIKEARKF